MMLRRNVLVFHAGALGDFVLTWPLVLAGARVFAQSRITCVVPGNKGPLAEKALRVESADAETGGWHALFTAPDRFDPHDLSDRSRKLLNGAHSILTFVASRGDAWTQNVSRVAPGAQIVCLNSRPAPDSTLHVTDHIASQLGEVPVLHAAMGQMIASIRERGVSGVRGGAADAPIVLHPGSGAERKCWPSERFVELARALASRSAPVRFVLGEVEGDTWPPERIARLRDAAELVRPADFVALHDLIASARAFVGNDTGPTHLAAILGVPTVALFGTDPGRWAPLGPRLSIVRGESIEAIGVDEVLASVLPG